MTAWRSIDEFCDAARATASKGDLNSALEMIVRFVITVISRDSSLAEVFSSPELDRLALELGRLPAKSEFQGSDEDQVVFLVTGIAPTGGHSRVLLDLIAADPAARATVLITNTEHDLRQSDVEGMFEFHGGAVEVAPVGNLATRLRWLQRRLASLRPARTYIFTHHFDPLCVAAAQPEISGRLFYYHNCDHSLALGVHLPHGTHIDFNGKSFHHCRQTKGVSNNIFWPLTAQVSKHRADLPFLTTGSLITCTSGGIGKVDNEHLYERIPYLYSYLKIVPLILNSTSGRHIHIGDLRDSMIEEITDGLARRGIPAESFVHVPRVPNLAEAMIDLSVDVYIGSFPSGGGRATVEAMGAGLPLILHSNYRSVFFSDVWEAYAGALHWRTPPELEECLRALTPMVLKDHARRSRRHYEVHHTPEALRTAVLGTLAGDTVTPPPAPSYQPNALQSWLDRKVAVDIELEGLHRDRQVWQDRAAHHEQRACIAERSATDNYARAEALAVDRQYLIEERIALRETFAWPIFTFIERQTRSLTRLKQARRRRSQESP